MFQPETNRFGQRIRFLRLKYEMLDGPSRRSGNVFRTRAGKISHRRAPCPDITYGEHALHTQWNRRRSHWLGQPYYLNSRRQDGNNGQEVPLHLPNFEGHCARENLLRSSIMDQLRISSWNGAPLTLVYLLRQWVDQHPPAKINLSFLAPQRKSIGMTSDIALANVLVHSIGDTVWFITSLSWIYQEGDPFPLSHLANLSG